MSFAVRLVVIAALAVSAPAPVAAQETDPDAPAHQTTYPSLRIRGFTDVVFGVSDEPSRSVQGFQLGQFVLHFASAVAKKVSFFGEVTATPGFGEHRIEVERSLVRYDYNDYFKISFGRYHTPLGYWNAAFHHGLWLQTTVRRPEPVRFGDAFFPVHFVGLLAEGATPTGGLGVSWTAGLGNGRSHIHSRGGDAGDDDTHRAWLVALRAQPTHVFGLDLGTGLYRDRFQLTARGDVDEWIVAAHAAWVKETPEIIVEFNGVYRDHVALDVETSHLGYYGQLAYRLPFDDSRWKPYARYEYVDFDGDDPMYFEADLQVVTAGVRFDPVPLAAFKAEYQNRLRRLDDERVQALLLQTSLTF